MERDSRAKSVNNNRFASLQSIYFFSLFYVLQKKKSLRNRMHADKNAPLNIFLEKEVSSVHTYIYIYYVSANRTREKIHRG